MESFWASRDGFRQSDRETLTENRTDIKVTLQVLARLEQRVDDDFRHNKEWHKARKEECDLIVKEIRTHAKNDAAEDKEFKKVVYGIKKEVDAKRNVALGKKGTWAIIGAVAVAVGSAALAGWSVIKLTWGTH